MLEVDLTRFRRPWTVQVAFRLVSGGCLGLFGGSGEGKSTVLSCIAGVDTPDEGRIVLDGQLLFPPQVPAHRRAIGYLTQKDHLFPHLSVADNVVFGLDRQMRATEAAWVAQLKHHLGLETFWHASARLLSGGQARRVALARMLARKPRLVLLDEPFTGLDRHVVRELIQVLLEWQRELRFTLVAVDHQAEVLAQICPRALVIEQGRVLQEGSWAELRAAPANPVLASLLAPH